MWNDSNLKKNGGKHSQIIDQSPTFHSCQKKNKKKKKQSFDNFDIKKLSEHQYGLRSNRSPTLAGMKLIEQLSTTIDDKDYTVGVFMI